MSNISISKAALDKIIEDKSARTALSAHHLIPRLLYHHRSYSTLNDGRTIEHGPGLTLSFIEPDEAESDHYLPVDPEAHGSLVVGPSTFFRTGKHEIDWTDRKFTLKSDQTNDR
jgi:hypothetical protein